MSDTTANKIPRLFSRVSFSRRKRKAQMEVTTKPIRAMGTTTLALPVFKASRAKNVPKKIENPTMSEYFSKVPVTFKDNFFQLQYNPKRIAIKR